MLEQNLYLYIIYNSSSSSKYITQEFIYHFIISHIGKKIAVLFSSVFFNINHLIVFFLGGLPIQSPFVLLRCVIINVFVIPDLKNIYTFFSVTHSHILFFSRLCINIIFRSLLLRYYSETCVSIFMIVTNFFHILFHILLCMLADAVVFVFYALFRRVFYLILSNFYFLLTNTDIKYCVRTSMLCSYTTRFSLK